MKTRLALFAMGSSLMLTTLTMPAQNIITNSFPSVHIVKYQDTFGDDRSLGEQSLLPPGIKEKLRLTDEQKTELKPIEDDFANTYDQYQIANQPRIEAAQEAIRRARESKDTTQIQAARQQLQAVWAGLQQYRDTAVIHIKPLLTPDQITILEDPKNQWRENHGNEANDPSAN
jgi:hypothetical protein